MNYYQFFAAATAGTVLIGCTPISLTDVSSTHYQLPANTTIVVRQTIVIPPGTAHVVLQDGRTVANDYLRRYEPFCELEVNDVLDAEQRVRPGRFTVTRIVRRQTLYGAERQAVLLAANTVGGGENDAAGAAIFIATRDDSYWLNQVRLHLQSAEQPKVRELRCAGGWALISNVAYPTLAEMNRALGALAGIEVH